MDEKTDGETIRSRSIVSLMQRVGEEIADGVCIQGPRQREHNVYRHGPSADNGTERIQHALRGVRYGGR